MRDLSVPHLKLSLPSWWEVVLLGVILHYIFWRGLLGQDSIIWDGCNPDYALILVTLSSLSAYFICVFHLIPMTTPGREATGKAWASEAKDPPKPSRQSPRARPDLRAPYPAQFSPSLLAAESIPFLAVSKISLVEQPNVNCDFHPLGGSLIPGSPNRE